MKRTLLTLFVAVLTLVSAGNAVTVDGFAYLTGQSNHTGTEVLFRAASPSAQTDSTYTDASGAFQADLHPGVYNVFYSHAGYANYPLPNQALLFATTLPAVTLMPPLSGSLSGTLGPGDFQVVDSISVDSGQALIIVAGTRLWFEPQKQLVVRGLLSAAGVEGDSVVFTKRFASADSLWGGLQFVNADNNCLLAYCVVEYAGNVRYYYNSYGGVVCDSSSPSIAHSTSRFNRTQHDYVGGGLTCLPGSAPTVTNCMFFGNRGNDGGGIRLYGSNAIFTDCVVDSNYSNGSGGGFRVSWGNPQIVNCYIRRNYGDYAGGGVFCSDSTGLIMSDCRICANYGENLGGGIAFYSTRGATPIVSHCVVSANRAYYASALYCTSANPIITQCTFVDDSVPGYYQSSVVLLDYSQAILSSCIIASFYARFAVSFSWSQHAQILYCDIFGRDSILSYPQFAPPAIGIIALTNALGDSCDTYYNIYQDPMFVDTANGDYHLRAESPCIDAGDPALPPDPDNTIADMGAFYYPHPATALEHFILHPSAFILSCYPNPFNSTTRIAFDLPHAAEVKLTVYDVTGRLAATLVSGKMSAGQHEFSFDGTDLASGVYFARIQAAELVRTQKLVLLK